MLVISSEELPDGLGSGSRPASRHARTVQRSPEWETVRRDASATQAEWSSLALLEIVVIHREQEKLCKLRFTSRGAYTVVLLGGTVHNCT